MKLFRSLLTPIHRALVADPDPINRARIHILFWIMSVTLVFSFTLLAIYLASGPPLQLIRVTLVVSAMSYGLYRLFAGKSFRISAHIALFILGMLVWTNIFLIIQAINIVTLQYILLTITFSFYLLGIRQGMFYSVLVLLPVVLFIIINGIGSIQVSISPQQASDVVFVTVMLFNFLLLLFVNYHFLKAFQNTIDRLKHAQIDEKILNEQLKDAIAVAEASSRAKSNFLSTMSHELRTPLNSVIGMSYLLMENNPREDQNDNLRILHFSAESLLGLINGILDFNKLEYGKIELERIEFKPWDLVSQIYAGLAHQADEKGLNFQIELDEKIRDLNVLGDSTRLLQILFNLIGNALKFTNQGSVTLKVESVESGAGISSLRFAVSDTGIGILPEQRQIIFEPFSQASSNITRRFGGTGLGLAITKQLLGLHNSQIEIKSEVGCGTTFTFVIAYQLIEGQDKPLEDAVSLQHEDDSSLAGLRILIAEDNPLNVLLMKKLFRNWRMNGDFVVNGQQAVEKALDHDYDVILMDIHMPLMDGYQASRSIRDAFCERGKWPWIIALTASVADEINAKIQAAGIDDYVLKPFNPIVLKERLMSVANRYDLQKSAIIPPVI